MSSKKALKALENPYKSGKTVNLGKARPKRKRFDPGLATDYYLTGGGYTEGSVNIFWGKESSGKSTAAYQKANRFPVKKVTQEIYEYIDESTGEVVKEEYTKEWKALILESEAGSVDAEYLEAIGCDPCHFDAKLVPTLEVAYNYIRENLQNYSVIIWDSVNGTGSEEGYSKGAEDRMMAVGAIRATDSMKIIQSMCYMNDTTLFGIFQARANMNKNNKYSPDDILSAPRAWRHATSIITHYDAGAFIESSDSDDIARRKTFRGKTIRVTCDKNKVNANAAGRNVTLTLVNGRGFDEVDDTFAVAKELNIIEGTTWLSYGETKLQGQVKFLDWMKSNPEKTEEIKQKCYVEIKKLNETKKED